MKTREVQQLIKEVRETPSFGASASGDIEAGRQALLERLGAETVNRPVYTRQDYADFAASFLFRSVARPLSVGVSSLVLALGGWVVAVNAASSSVPGDTLYPVKIATERVQLTLTTSSEQRTKLHMEFAGRRLQEVTDVQGSDRVGKTVRVQSALEGFRKEIASVKNEMASVSEKNPEAASKIAEYVDEKTDEYTTQIRTRLASEDIQVSEDTRAEAEAAQNEAVAVNQGVVEALVSRHETLATVDTDDSEQLQGLFREDLNDIQAQIAQVQSRLAVITDVLEVHSELDETLRTNSQEVISKIESRLLDVQPEISAAADALAAGGYRTTFEVMGEMKDTVSVVHNLLAQLEVQISVALANISEQTSETEEVLDSESPESVLESSE